MAVGGDGDGDGGGGSVCVCRSSVWLQVCLVTISGKDWLRPVKPVFCQS